MQKMAIHAKKFKVYIYLANSCASVSAKAEQDARSQVASSQVQRKYGNDVIENGRHPSICIYQNGDHELRKPSLQWTQQPPPGADPKGHPVKLSESSPALPFYGFYNDYIGYNEHISKNNSQYFWQGNNVHDLEGHHATVDIPSAELQSKSYSLTNNGISNSKIDAGLWYGYMPMHQTAQQLHQVATLQVGALRHQIQVHASNTALQNSFFSNSKSSYDPSMEYTVDGSQVPGYTIILFGCSTSFQASFQASAFLIGIDWTPNSHFSFGLQICSNHLLSFRGTNEVE